MSGYVCGWDGGGTKTEVLCLSLNGETLADAAFGPLNLNGADARKQSSQRTHRISFP